MPRIAHLALSALTAFALASPAMLAAQAPADATNRRIAQILEQTPLIDGHNDLPWEIRESYDFWRKPLDINGDTTTSSPPLQTDLPRLRKGHVGAQFWSVWIPGKLSGAEAIQTTLEQIDIVHRMVARYPTQLEMASTAADIRRIHKAGKIASLIGAEGGHQIGNSLAALRQYHALGVRYLTLTHGSNNDWADSATDDPVHHGLTDFGRDVIREMNRIGMFVDLSHVSAETMKAALQVTKAPVIFSHSDARALMDHPRNVPDDVLRLLPANGGVVMVNFYPGFISGDYARWDADRAAERTRLADLYPGQPDRVKAAMQQWDQAHQAPKATIAQVADHIEHIRDIAGVDHVGIGGDLDGMGGSAVEGLGGADRYPFLLRELIGRGWSDADLAKLAGGNLLRAMTAMEKVAVSLSGEQPVNSASPAATAGK